MSKMVTKVDVSVDDKNGLSTTIDKALVLKGEETQLKCSPEFAEGAPIDLTSVQVAKKHDEKAISDKTATEEAESENVVAESVPDQQVLSEKAVVKKAAEEKMTIEKSTVANVAVEKAQTRERHIPTGDTYGHITTWCRCELTAGGLDHLRERMKETNEFLAHHGDGAAGCTKERWTVSDWKKSEGKQGS